MTRASRFALCAMFCLVLALAGGCASLARFPSRGATPVPRRSVVQVTVTSQTYSPSRPWKKTDPQTKRGLGAVVSGARVLVTATLVENATNIEVQVFGSEAKLAARVACVDYSANLAVLALDEPKQLQNMIPLPIAASVKPGDEVAAWQFEDNGVGFVTPGEIREIVTEGYPYGAALLVYKLEINLTRVTSSYTIPVVRNGQLVGLLMNYAPNTRIMTLTPAPVIAHFLGDLDDGQYDGFPVAGFRYANLIDPQLRAYAGLDPEGTDGVYLSYIRPGSPAAQAGLRVGDVLLKIDQFPLSSRGEYEEPRSGQLAASNLVALARPGQVRIFHIRRDGKPLELPVTMAALDPALMPVPALQFDRPPQYLIAGGLVMLELSLQYLQEWGKDWDDKAPRRLVYANAKQWELFPAGSRVVFLSQVLPSDGTLGYTDFGGIRIVAVNDRPIRRLADVAAALEHPVPGADGKTLFHHFRFDDHPFDFYLEASTVNRENEVIRKRYSLPDLSRLQP